MARGVVEKAAGRNAKAVSGEGGGRRLDGPQGVRCGSGKCGGGRGWRAMEAGKLLVSARWAMTHAAWNALVHALIGNTVTCHGCGGAGHYERSCPERGTREAAQRGGGRGERLPRLPLSGHDLYRAEHIETLRRREAAQEFEAAYREAVST